MANQALAFSRTTLLLILITVLSLHTGAQTTFITQGRVEYEKKVNQHKPLEEGESNPWTAEMLKVYPKFVNDVYELRFNENRSVFKMAKENTDNKYIGWWGGKPNGTDFVLHELSQQSMTTQREVFENTYVIKDSVRNLQWRITNETRDIAGFECRKAVTIICDSVYVVAFYTDQIPVSAGPESFGGLPGLILGLAIPRLYTTWFATKLELVEPTATQLTPTAKGKKVNRAQLEVELKKGLGDWGKEGHKRIWQASL